MSRRILHFTIGPVQGFVAQARRTRDLWGGSFLLSWLSGVAMNAVMKEGGRILFPIVQSGEGVNDALLAAIQATPLKANPNPSIGSLPNRFKASVPSGFDDASDIAEQVRHAFKGAAEAVRKHYLDGIIASQASRAIWDRQVNSFWEIAWVVGDDPGDGSDAGWLDARKHWRQPASLEPEGGDHCTVMHSWQELSGVVRSQERERQNRFWQAVRARVGDLDLRPDERLCAIAFVKRMLPKLAASVAENPLGWQPDVKTWPSTAYMAAVPWIKAAWEQAPTECRLLARLAQRHFHAVAWGERETRLASLETVDKVFSGLDGNTFHLAALQNPRTTPLKQEAGREGLADALDAIQKLVGEAASPYYALLLMDGDSLGDMLRRGGSPSRISAALAAFTEFVQSTVSAFNGVTVYAGGDDVLAMLPNATAIDAALALKKSYSEAFTKYEVEDASISGAIVYSHFKQPLQAVLSEAHELLDAIAKNENGRASLAISLLQGAGKNLQWVSTWDSGEGSPPEQVQQLASRFRADKLFSSRFFHGLEGLFGMMDANTMRSGFTARLELDEAQMKRWMVAEYLDDRERRVNERDAEEAVNSLMAVCSRNRRKPGEFELQASGARLVKFLAFPGEEV